MDRVDIADMRHVLREFFLGFVRIHILHHAGEEPVYGVALIVELRRHGYELSPGTLYPVLHQLEKAGYLRRLNRVVRGRVRKYYVLTRRGGHTLSDAREKIAELVEEVLAARGTPRRTPARKASMSATRSRRSGGRGATSGR
jgi:DNA-binding PadR family transcriptional regulator